MTTTLDDMARVVMSNGDIFSGGSIERGTEIAEEWIDNEFSADQADEWMTAGFWMPSVAAECRDAGMSPEACTDTAEKLLDACGDREGAADTYTDGSPIYAMCNSDYSVDKFIAAFKSN